jgi:hypothetical protein
MTNRTRVNVFLDVFAHVESKILFFKKFNVRSCSKCLANESSWFCLRSSLLRNFEKMYHLFFQRSKSFSMFHLKNESRSIFRRISFDKIFAFTSNFWRFASSFLLSCVIDTFSTRDHTRCVNESDLCRISNMMRNFKNETMNVDFLLETFFIQSLNARSSLFAMFSNWSYFDVSSITRNDDLKDFFFFKFFFTIATIFIFFWMIFAIEFNARAEFWFSFWR